MTRPLFFLTALAGMLMAMTAVLIRMELAYPDVSPLFMTETGHADSQRFIATSTLHRIFGYLAVILLGTTMCAEAHLKGVRPAILPMVIGAGLSGLLVVALVLANLPHTPEDSTGVGWVLYPPLSADPVSYSPYFTTVLDWVGLDPLHLPNLASYLLLPAAVMLLLGCYAMTATLPKCGWILFAGLALSVATVAVILTAPQTRGGYFPLGAFHVLTFPLLIPLTIHLIDRATPWVMLLTLGLVATSIAQVTVFSIVPSAGRGGTTADIVPLYVFPLGISWFALPALFLFARTPRWPDWCAPVAAFALTGSLAVWLFPLLRLGQEGQPTLYLDYPDTFAGLNLKTSAAVLIFVAVFLTTLTLARRAHRCPKNRTAPHISSDP